MAISKVGTYRNPPEDITDYTAIAGHLNAFLKQVGSQAMILTEWTNTTGTPSIAMGSYISHGGVLYIAQSEEAIALPVADGTYYLKVEASGDTLVLSWISNLSGYSWNAIANGLYHADESQVLPYMMIKTGTSLEKWKITNLMQGSGFNVVNYLGAVKCTTLDTGQGANQLYPMNQDVRDSASPTFVNVNAKVNDAEFYNGAKRGIRPINQTTTLSQICDRLKDYYPFNNYQLNLSGVIIFGGDTYIPFFSTGHLFNGVIIDISIETINLSTNEKTTLSVTPSDSTSAYIYLVI